MKNKDGEVVKLIVDSKVWHITRKMVNATIALAKRKYDKMNVNAIIAVEKDGMISLQKDVYNETDAFEEAIANWTNGGYKCYHTTNNGGK